MKIMISILLVSYSIKEGIGLEIINYLEHINILKCFRVTQNNVTKLELFCFVLVLRIESRALHVLYH
jgi:hypothetical protein